MNQIEQLPALLARRNWLVLGLLLLISIPFADLKFSAGILAGGLVSIGGFLWLRRSLEQLIDQPTGGARFRYQFGYFVRLIVLLITLGVLVAVVKLHTVGLIIGLSVVIINLFWITAQRALK